MGGLQAAFLRQRKQTAQNLRIRKSGCRKSAHSRRFAAKKPNGRPAGAV